MWTNLSAERDIGAGLETTRFIVALVVGGLRDLADSVVFVPIVWGAPKLECLSRGY
jgi:hypothetical protein